MRGQQVQALFYLPHSRELPWWLIGKKKKKAKKNLPTVQETQETRVRSLVWEGPPEEEMATHSCQENLVDREAWWATVHGGHKESDVTQHTPHLIANKFRENKEWKCAFVSL